MAHVHIHRWDYISVHSNSVTLQMVHVTIRCMLQMAHVSKRYVLQNGIRYKTVRVTKWQMQSWAEDR